MSPLEEIELLPISESNDQLAQKVELVLACSKTKFKGSSRPKYSKFEIAEALLETISYQVDDLNLPSELKGKIYTWISNSYDQSNHELVDIFSTLYLRLGEIKSVKEIKEKIRVTKNKKSIAYLKEALSEIESHT